MSKLLDLDGNSAALNTHMDIRDAQDVEYEQRRALAPDFMPEAEKNLALDYGYDDALVTEYMQ